MCRIIYISEQHRRLRLPALYDDLKLVFSEKEYIKPFFHKPDMMCFQFYSDTQDLTVNSNYFIGVDWLVSEKVAIYIEPKLNDELNETDFLGMLMESLEATENLEHLEGLYHVDYNKPPITIPDQKNVLSPILIIQFLKLTQKIVQKGLMKSYYRVTENLNNRVKGKILVSSQIKENLVKNRMTNTICNYQEFGINTKDNQFLKLVLEFVSSWLSSRAHYFEPLQQSIFQNLLNYCLPAFQHVDVLFKPHLVILCKKNVFYKEYEAAIKIGQAILKYFSFNITKTSLTQSNTPPFWIDMSKLFELYVFKQLKQIFPEPGLVTYHDRFRGGKETDILIRADQYRCVVDCKYKPQYENNEPTLEDKRQLAGYTRLKSVYHKLSVIPNTVVKGVIIYSYQGAPTHIQKSDLFKTNVEEYVDFFKIGIRLPVK